MALSCPSEVLWPGDWHANRGVVLLVRDPVAGEHGGDVRTNEDEVCRKNFYWSTRAVNVLEKLVDVLEKRDVTDGLPKGSNSQCPRKAGRCPRKAGRYRWATQGEQQSQTFLNHKIFHETNHNRNPQTNHSHNQSQISYPYFNPRIIYRESMKKNEEEGLL